MAFLFYTYKKWLLLFTRSLMIFVFLLYTSIIQHTQKKKKTLRLAPHELPRGGMEKKNRRLLLILYSSIAGNILLRPFVQSGVWSQSWPYTIGGEYVMLCTCTLNIMYTSRVFFILLNHKYLRLEGDKRKEKHSSTPTRFHLARLKQWVPFSDRYIMRNQTHGKSIMFY